MSCFVLIHGSWHGAWCWSKVVPLLERAGHHVVTPDLPGHGEDRTPIAEITLDSYADRICEVIESCAERVILVGHSMGGGAITHAAERCEKAVRMLVYLAAYLPGSGVSIADQAMQDDESMVSRHVVIDPVGGTASLDAAMVTDCFYGDCARADVEYARARLRVDPLAPLVSPLASGAEAAQRLPGVYIECLRDRTITPEMQRRIHSSRSWAQVLSLDTSHSPFFSAPERLVRHLLAAAELAS